MDHVLAIQEKNDFSYISASNNHKCGVTRVIYLLLTNNSCTDIVQMFPEIPITCTYKLN